MKSKLIIAALWMSACLLNLVSLPAHAVAVSGQGTWETTLLARDFDGDGSTVEGWYDTVLGITWLADANHAGTGMDWDSADAWAASLDINGISGWRLPAMLDTGTAGCSFGYSGTDCGWNVQTSSGMTVYSELASLFYDTLGNIAYYDTSGNGPQADWGLSNTGPFANVQSNYYWTGLAYAPLASEAWFFGFHNGLQDSNPRSDSFPYAWAVHAGDVGTALVPLPAAAWLFACGLLGLAGIARRRIA